MHFLNALQLGEMTFLAKLYRLTPLQLIGFKLPQGKIPNLDFTFGEEYLCHCAKSCLLRRRLKIDSTYVHSVAINEFPNQLTKS